jgi:hypothetical protein
MVAGRVSLHGLPHDVAVDALAGLAGIVKRLKNALYTLFVEIPIDFWKPQVKANQQGTPHTVQGKQHPSVARRVILQIALGAEAFVIAVGDPAFRRNQVQTVVRLIRRCQRV